MCPTLARAALRRAIMKRPTLGHWPCCWLTGQLPAPLPRHPRRFLAGRHLVGTAGSYGATFGRAWPMSSDGNRRLWNH